MVKLCVNNCGREKHVTINGTVRSKCLECLNAYNRQLRGAKPKSAQTRERERAQPSRKWGPKHVARYKKFKERNKFAYVAYRMNQRAAAQGHFETIHHKDLEKLAAAQPSCIDCGSTEHLTFGHLFPLQYAPSTHTLDNLARQCRTHNAQQSMHVHHSVADKTVYGVPLRLLYPIWHPNT